MTKHPAIPTPAEADVDAPLDAFSQCHAGIMGQLKALAGLPELAAAAALARSVAAESLRVFKHAVLEHHVEEESELFPAVLRSAHPGEEQDRVQALVNRLTGEHRTMEALWKRLEPAVAATAKGKPDADELDAAVVEELVRAYGAHAAFEESQFLPLAALILGRNGNHMAALGLSLHMRHAPQPIGYI